MNSVDGPRASSFIIWEDFDNDWCSESRRVSRLARSATFMPAALDCVVSDDGKRA